MLVDGSTIAVAAVARQLSSHLAVGGNTTRRGVRIDPAGAVVAVPEIQVQRSSATGWTVGDEPTLDVDDDGVPCSPDGATVPLERA